MNEVGLGKWSISVCGSSMRGNRREGSFTGQPKDIPSKALELDFSFHMGPIFRTWEDAPLLGLSTEEEIF